MCAYKSPQLTLLLLSLALSLKKKEEKEKEKKSPNRTLTLAVSSPSNSAAVELALVRRLRHPLRRVVLVIPVQGIGRGGWESSSPSRSSSPTPAGVAVVSGRCKSPPASLSSHVHRG